MSNNQKTYYIGDISKELDLSARAIRYYEELGFIRPLRTDGGFRTYSERDVALLKVVIRFKDLGMSLDEIGTLILPGRDTLTVDAIHKLKEALSVRREEFQSKKKKYEEGIEQIDRVLELLSNCNECGRPSGQGICENCLKQHGGDISPLIAPLIS